MQNCVQMPAGEVLLFLISCLIGVFQPVWNFPALQKSNTGFALSNGFGSDISKNKNGPRHEGRFEKRKC